MKIILSPAKQMMQEEFLDPITLPQLLPQAKTVAAWLKGLDYEAAKKLWQCSENLAQQSYAQLQKLDLEKNLSPAVLAYDGIAYKYMAPSVFENGEFAYVQEHLRILSGLYGVLRPMDGVAGYRLEMQAKATVAGTHSLYEYWSDALYRAVRDESGVIINLASKEYSKCIEKYLTPQDRYITCIFGEVAQGRIVQKGVYAKMARGEMVRFMAVHEVEQPEEMQSFAELGYRFSPEHSSETVYTFLRRSLEISAKNRYT